MGCIDVAIFKHMSAGIEIVAFSYDDLVKIKRFAVENVFKYTGISMELVDAVVHGFEKDSQTKSGISTKDFRTIISKVQN